MINNKITISGYQINKKKYTHQETIELIKKYQETKDINIKELLVIDNTRLVLSMMKRFSKRCDNSDDLFQVGMIGLIKAIDNFNTDYNLQFSTYAVPLIIGEMKRYLRDNSQVKISRTIRDLAYKILQCKDQFMIKYEREPSVKEIAKLLEVNKKQVVEALNSTNSVTSLQDELKCDDGNALKVIDQIADKKVISNEMLDLKEAIGKLPDKEKRVIDDRYFNGLSQMEIADDLFISQAQVSRIEKKALRDLHKLLS